MIKNKFRVYIHQPKLQDKTTVAVSAKEVTAIDHKAELITTKVSTSFRTKTLTQLFIVHVSDI